MIETFNSASYFIKEDSNWNVLPVNFDDIGIFDLASERMVKVLKGHKDLIRDVCISPDERIIISGSEDETTRLWDFETGREIRELEGCAENICISSDAKYLIRGIFTSINIEDFNTFEKINNIETNLVIEDLLLSHDEKFIIQGARHVIKIWGISKH